MWDCERRPGHRPVRSVGGAGVSSTADRKDPEQMVPTTRGAHLHNVRRVVVPGPLKFGDLGTFRDETPVLRQPVAEHVREQHDIHLFTDLTECVRWFTEILRGADEFRMRIAHGVTIDATALVLVDHTASSESVVDNADITSQHVDGETHGSTRYF